MGYYKSRKGYIIWDITKVEIVVLRDVSFGEDSKAKDSAQHEIINDKSYIRKSKDNCHVEISIPDSTEII